MTIDISLPGSDAAVSIANPVEVIQPGIKAEESVVGASGVGLPGSEDSEQVARSQRALHATSAEVILRRGV